MIVLIAVKFHPLPAMLDEVYHDTRDLLVILQKMRGQPTAKYLDRLDLLLLPGQRIDRVLHRVGRQAKAVVALGVNSVKIAFESDIDSQVLYLVALSAAVDL